MKEARRPQLRVEHGAMRCERRRAPAMFCGQLEFLISFVERRAELVHILVFGFFE